MYGPGLASVVTVWKVGDEGLSILHEVVVGVGPPLLMSDLDGKKAGRDGFLLASLWMAVDLVLSWLEAKSPIQVNCSNHAVATTSLILPLLI